MAREPDPEGYEHVRTRDVGVHPLVLAAFLRTGRTDLQNRARPLLGTVALMQVRISHPEEDDEKNRREYGCDEEMPLHKVSRDRSGRENLPTRILRHTVKRALFQRLPCFAYKCFAFKYNSFLLIFKLYFHHNTTTFNYRFLRGFLHLTAYLKLT